MSKSLHTILNRYKSQDIYPFHMPGHKQNADFMPEDLLHYDITEIPGADNLQKPEGVLRELEEKISAACGSKSSFISVNGSSGGILAALLSAVTEGDELLLARNSHIASYNGLVLSGAEPVYVYPHITPQGLCGGIMPQDIENALAGSNKIKAVLITSPTYEGFCSDIKGIAEVVHRHKKILIVDEAHGAHFGYHPAFPGTAISLGADISIQSLHKTLPAFGQSSVVHIGSNRVDAKRLKQSLNMVNSTSPSYIFLAGIDFLFSNTLKKPFDIFERYALKLTKFEDNARHLECIEMPAKSLKGKFGITDIDKGKLVFCVNHGIITGQEISSILLKDHKVQVEAAYSKHIIAMTSIADTAQGFSRLTEGLYSVDEMLKPKGKYDIITSNYDHMSADTALSPRQAFNFEKETLPPDAAIGRICGEFVVPYPPGIPIVAPGEMITEGIAKKLKEHFDGSNTNEINVLLPD